MTLTLLHGDALDRLRTLPDASVDALVTDPPAGISFMGKAWDSDKGGRDEWIAWLAEIMREALRVLKPGAHALVWALPRTSHWTATAIEDAGFEIRDTLAHFFGSGFPKSKRLLKPGREDWILASKPGPGALNIDECRIDGGARPLIESKSEPSVTTFGNGLNGSRHAGTTTEGRWPANVTLDEEAARALDEQSGTLTSGARKPGTYVGMGYEGADAREYPAIDGDAGGASRFYYCAKASTAERNAGLGGRRNPHPTPKPIALMRWLVRLITPSGGVVLDPFLGSGTTGIAALAEGASFIGIEREAEYIEIARARIAHAEAEAAKPKRAPKAKRAKAPKPEVLTPNPPPTRAGQLVLFTEAA